MKPLMMVLLVVLSLLGTSFAQQSSRPRLVGNIKNNSFDGCGCYFRFPAVRDSAQRYIYVESIEEDKGAWMNIDGQDVHLKLLTERSRTGRERVGRRWSRKFAADNISVSSVYTATRVCDSNDENCESTDYSAVFVVKKGNRTQTLRAVGYCGC